MTERGDPLGLLDAIRRDIDRVVGMVRSREDNPDPVDVVSPAEVDVPPVPPEFDTETVTLLERKREEWLASGIPPCLVRMGMEQATAGAQGMAWRMELFAREVDKPAVMRDYIENVADAWVRAMSDAERVGHGDAT